MQIKNNTNLNFDIYNKNNRIYKTKHYYTKCGVKLLVNSIEYVYLKIKYYLPILFWIKILYKNFEIFLN